MEMDVTDSIGRLAWEARGIEVLDVADQRVEQIEDIDAEPQSRSEVIADAEIDERRRPRAHAAVFDQRARPEVAQAEAAVEVVELGGGDAGRQRLLDRARDVTSDRIEIREATRRARVVGVDLEPRPRTPERLDLDAATPARPRRLVLSIMSASTFFANGTMPSF